MRSRYVKVPYVKETIFRTHFLLQVICPPLMCGAIPLSHCEVSCFPPRNFKGWCWMKRVLCKCTDCQQTGQRLLLSETFKGLKACSKKCFVCTFMMFCSNSHCFSSRGYDVAAFGFWCGFCCQTHCFFYRWRRVKTPRWTWRFQWMACLWGHQISR